MSTRTLRAGQTAIEITKDDKVLFPEAGITKGALAEYYQQIAPTMVRHTRERPLAAERFPDGITGQRIFQKNVGEHFPDWIRRVEVPKKEGGTTVHAVCEDTATLVYLADQGCVTPHVWLSRVDELNAPDRMILDLDPSGQDLAALRVAARTVGDLLEEIGLVTFLMTTGSRGYHVVVPLRRTDNFERARELAHEVASTAAEREPRVLTVQQRKQDRGDRVFLDYLRNAYAQTAVAPYSARAREGAPVATPLWWQELDTTTPWQYTIDDIVDRTREHGDPWKHFAHRARSLEQPRQRLQRIRAE